MGNGTRILLNADGIITDWAKQHFEPVSSPLSAIANPKVAFDLFTPVDNSRHGFTVQQGVQKLKAYGLQFPSTAGSQTTFTEPGAHWFVISYCVQINSSRCISVYS
ncbi:hypothetical protein IE979_21845 [Klebsiella pneumoniae]|uniref:Uncharacterized protein n=1 Tax=Klebsiella pneumoniae TaxID=573 RepID=A0A927DTB1_KLEPN|nr:hypothetical protein [Klebsiella pneumoniae]